MLAIPGTSEAQGGHDGESAIWQASQLHSTPRIGCETVKTVERKTERTRLEESLRCGRRRRRTGGTRRASTLLRRTVQRPGARLVTEGMASRDRWEGATVQSQETKPPGEGRERGELKKPGCF